jgi:hypothetical protein
LSTGNHIATLACPFVHRRNHCVDENESTHSATSDVFMCTGELGV